MTLPARAAVAYGRPDARPSLFRSERLTVRDTAVVERCGTRHQLAFARLPAAPRYLRLDDSPPRDPTCVLVVPAGELPPTGPSASAVSWTVLGFARDRGEANATWPATSVVASAAPHALLRLHVLRTALPLATAVDIEDMADGLLEEILATRADEPGAYAAGGERRREIVDGARRVVARAPGSRHPLPDVARALGISSSHLAHVFRAEAGMPLHRWLLHLRLAVALEQLARGDAHLSALALDLGFATHSHFSAAFRQWCGVTPGAARALLVRSTTSDARRRDVSA